MLNQTVNDPTLHQPAKASCCGSKRVEVQAPIQSSILIYIQQYQPIIAIAVCALIGAMLLPSGHQHGPAIVQPLSVFMGLFLFPLALLKLFDIGGFARAFARYDVLAKKLPAYAVAYPFIEMALALSFLCSLWPDATHFAALIIGAIGTIGIVKTLAEGEAVQCACVGSAIKVPLGAVSILENAGMAVMAAFLLYIG